MKPNMVLFSHIHKSGGTTMKWITRNSFGLRHFEVDPLHTQAAFPDTAVYHPNGVIDRAKCSLKAIDAQGLARISKGFPHVVSLQSHNLSPAQDLGNHRWFNKLRMNASRLQPRGFYERVWLPRMRRKMAGAGT